MSTARGGAGVAERRADETVFVKATAEVTNPVTNLVALPQTPGGEPLEFSPFEDPRHELVDWMSDPANPYFAKAWVNRMWAHFFGRGLVEPMDDLRATNPATIEALLDELAVEFTNSGFNMRHVLRLICTSATYQRSSIAPQRYLDETQNHSRFYPQRLTAEVLLDSVDQVSGVRTSYSGLPSETRAVELPDEDYSNEFLKLFGRPPRESACECERAAEPSLSQSLFLLNNKFVLDKTRASNGYAAKLASSQLGEQAKIQEMFMTVFSREPDARELAEALAYLQAEKDSKTALGNLLWALLNTKEFLYVH